MRAQTHQGPKYKYTTPQDMNVRHPKYAVYGRMTRQVTGAAAATACSSCSNNKYI